MKKISKFLGTFFLGVAAFVIVIAPASFFGVAVEELPKSIKIKR